VFLTELKRSPRVSPTPDAPPHTKNTSTARRRSRGFLPLLGVSVALALTAGCAVVSSPFPALDSTKFTLENTDRFALLDPSAQSSVTCTGLQEIPLADGRLEVVANLKNREDRPVQVQINCVFKDEEGFGTGDETPFQTVNLAEHATEAVRFTAVNNLARKYTIRVRQPR
jgi:hypothetical protein